MKTVLLFGPQAVGKMTVGNELAKLTDLKLFHNHMTIELLHPFFGFSAETWRLSTLFRKEIFKAVAKSAELNGIIFTFVWAFDQQEDWDFVDDICQIFESKGGDVYFVELEAEIEERLERNKSVYRLEQKPTKRNVKQSEAELKRTLEKHRLNSEKGEITKDHYLKINNTNVSSKQVAKTIKERFSL
ncbi:AAA family ATPase [Halalkalibacter kiskunsagensis]|uniref:AAA family ATPase n=1 Tax=Halalkalibacter kiskunsagensis TaxID=1548599 RepID=A0ABV6KFB5_9BACI